MVPASWNSVVGGSLSEVATSFNSGKVRQHQITLNSPTE